MSKSIFISLALMHRPINTPSQLGLDLVWLILYSEHSRKSKASVIRKERIKEEKDPNKISLPDRR